VASAICAARPVAAEHNFKRVTSHKYVDPRSRWPQAQMAHLGLPRRDLGQRAPLVSARPMGSGGRTV